MTKSPNVAYWETVRGCQTPPDALGEIKHFDAKHGRAKPDTCERENFFCFSGLAEIGRYPHDFSFSPDRVTGAGYFATLVTREDNRPKAALKVTTRLLLKYNLISSRANLPAYSLHRQYQCVEQRGLQGVKGRWGSHQGRPLSIIPFRLREVG